MRLSKENKAALGTVLAFLFYCAFFYVPAEGYTSGDWSISYDWTISPNWNIYVAPTPSPAPTGGAAGGGGFGNTITPNPNGGDTPPDFTFPLVILGAVGVGAVILILSGGKKGGGR